MKQAAKMKSTFVFNDMNYLERKSVVLPESRCSASFAQKEDDSTRLGASAL
jgi:hypothetical protein